MLYSFDSVIFKGNKMFFYTAFDNFCWIFYRFVILYILLLYLQFFLYCGSIVELFYVLSAILHMYFARFIQKCLFHIGLVSYKEPFKELLVQGMVKSKSYQIRDTGKYLSPEEVDFSGLNA